jgi:hypothetical protein
MTSNVAKFWLSPVLLLHTQNLTAEVYILTKEEGGRHTPFFKGYKPQFYFRTTDVTGEVELPADKEMVMPGDTITFKVKLLAPNRYGTRFALCYPRRRPHRRRRRSYQNRQIIVLPRMCLKNRTMSGFLFVDHTLKNTYRLKSELPGDEICGDEKTKRIYASPSLCTD